MTSRAPLPIQLPLYLPAYFLKRHPVHCEQQHFAIVQHARESCAEAHRSDANDQHCDMLLKQPSAVAWPLAARTQHRELLLKRGSDSLLAPEAIAEAYYNLHLQQRSAWTLELDLRPWTEKF